MEYEVSSMVKLGVVLIALSVLISLAFGVFEISKGTANTGVNNLQAELDKVETTKFSTYDQTVLNGTTLRSAFYDFQGDDIAILIATQSWIDLINTQSIENPQQANSNNGEYKGTGIANAYDGSGEINMSLPMVYVYNDMNFTDPFKMYTSKQRAVNGCFINYNALLGMASSKVGTGASLEDAGVTRATVALSSSENDQYNMAGIFFDGDKFVCTSGFCTDDSGRIQHNYITINLKKTGTTEFIPTGGKFNSYLIKDMSGTILGFACMQTDNK